MDRIIKKGTINFGKHRVGTLYHCPFDVEIELRYVSDDDEPWAGYTELAITGCIWRSGLRHDAIQFGQCLDDMLPYLKDNDLFQEIYVLWKQWHLNSMHPGTPEQEKILSDAGICGDYDQAVKYLTSCDMCDVTYTGKAVGHFYYNESYRYGSGWIVKDLPLDVIGRVCEIIDEYSIETD